MARSSLRLGIGVTVALLAPCTGLHAAVHHVRSTGGDSPTCGTLGSPCRSITRAIANAAAGDSILVGPGLYGDVDGDGTLSGANGEEPNLPACTAGSCMIRVDKSVELSSTDGAAATVLRAPAGLNLDIVVSLESDDAVLGRPNRGFTIVGASERQVNALLVSGLTVAGNRVLPGALTAIDLAGTDGALVSHNVAIGPFDGSDAGGIGVAGHGVRLLRNTASGFGTGLVIGGPAWTAVGNVATDNRIGMFISVQEAPLGPRRFERNSVVGNISWGIFVSVINPGPNTLTLTRGNLFGNGDIDGFNCGVGVFFSFFADELTLNVDRYFWGAPGGPGPNPADSFSAFCSDITGSIAVNATNSVTQPYVIRVPPQR